MSDIFICYSRQDFPIADCLMQQLQAEGWSVFIDKQTHVGRRWHKEIEQELQAARAIVVLWSTTSRDSDYVLEEAEYGKRKDCLFPAFIEFVEPPYGFSRIQTADLTGWKNGDQSGTKGLVNALRLHLNGETTQVDAPIENTVPIPPIPEQPINAQSKETKSEQTEINKPWSPMKKLLSVSALVLLGFIIFPVFEWVTGIDGSIDVDELSPDQKPSLQTDPSNNKFLPTMVHIPAGSFNFGSSGKHVEISEPFYLSKHEITYEQYDHYVQEQQSNGHDVRKPRTATGGRGKQPVVYVDWSEAMAYTTWLDDKNCRLPTEFEWEYAARAGTDTVYPWGHDLGDNNANCRECGSQWDGEQAAPVGSFAANDFDLHDMSGNVWEWTCSNMENTSDDAIQECPEIVDDEARVLRGGSWYDLPVSVRWSARFYSPPDGRLNGVGFRVLCSSPIE